MFNVRREKRPTTPFPNKSMTYEELLAWASEGLTPALERYIDEVLVPRRLESYREMGLIRTHRNEPIQYDLTA